MLRLIQHRIWHLCDCLLEWAVCPVRQELNLYMFLQLPQILFRADEFHVVSHLSPTDQCAWLEWHQNDCNRIFSFGNLRSGSAWMPWGLAHGRDVYFHKMNRLSNFGKIWRKRSKLRTKKIHKIWVPMKNKNVIRFFSGPRFPWTIS